MKNIIIWFFFLATLMSCKSDKKNNKIIEQVAETEVVGQDNSKKVEVKKSFFEEKLSDYRDLERQFVDNYKLDKFGSLKINDSVFAFVFKLNKNTTAEMVKKYSIGLRGYSYEKGEPLKASFAPEIKTRNKENFLILPKNTNGIKYFDSIEVYIYKRKDFKASGRIGTIKVKDILLEE